MTTPAPTPLPAPGELLAALEEAGFTRFSTQPQYVGMVWPPGSGMQPSIIVPVDPDATDYRYGTELLLHILQRTARAGTAASAVLKSVTADPEPAGAT